MSGWYSLHRDHVTLGIRLTPGASRDAIDGVTVLDDGRPVLAVRVRAVAEKGRANDALVSLVARYLGRPKSACRVISGTTARRKVVRVDGDVPTVVARLAEIAAAGGDPKRG